MHFGRHEGVHGIGGIGLADAAGEHVSLRQDVGDAELSAEPLLRCDRHVFSGFGIDVRCASQRMEDGRGTIEVSATDVRKVGQQLVRI
jgi:hypothetical protein